MIEANQGKEVVVTVKNEAGLLSEISKLLSERGIGIQAFIGAVSGDECLIRLVTDDTLRTKDALAERGYPVEEEDVILVKLPHKPGMLRRIAEVLVNENIDIRYAYASALEEHEKCLLILHTDNDEHALPRLSKSDEALRSRADCEEK